MLRNQTSPRQSVSVKLLTITVIYNIRNTCVYPDRGKEGRKASYGLPDPASLLAHHLSYARCRFGVCKLHSVRLSPLRPSETPCRSSVMTLLMRILMMLFIMRMRRMMMIHFLYYKAFLHLLNGLDSFAPSLSNLIYPDQSHKHHYYYSHIHTTLYYRALTAIFHI